MRTMRLTRSVVATLAATIIMSSGAAIAQRGGGGGAPGMPGGGFPLSRMESLQEAFKLEGDKKKAVKDVLDAAHKSAAPVREALLSAHAALGTAAEGGSQDATDAAARAYGTQAAAMARLEMDAIVKVLAIADPELQNQQGIQAAFFMARGMFLKNGKWDEIPERNIPSY
jgi:hypothetical protein